MINQTCWKLGNEASVIRQIFEFGAKRKAEVGVENVYDFSIGNPSVEPPRELHDALEKNISELNSLDLHGYTSSPGRRETRESICEYLRTTYGARCSWERMYLTCGASASLMIAMKAVTTEKSNIIVFKPYFPEYKIFIEALSCEVKEVGYDNRMLPDMEEFERSIDENTDVVLINSPNNPTGAIYGEETLERMSEILERANEKFGKRIYLVSDEPYRELVYDTDKAPYPANYYKDTISCYSFSKSMSVPGERIGYVLVHDTVEAAEDVWFSILGAGRSLGFICAPSLFQKIVGEVVGHFSDISIYKKNRDILLEHLGRLGYECVHPQGAFYLFIKAPGKMSSDMFFEEAKKKDILVVPSESFGVPGHLRLAYCVDTEMIVRSLKALDALTEELKTKGLM